MVLLPSDFQVEQLTLKDIKSAYTLIEKDICVTPVFNFPEFDSLVDFANCINVYLKAELFQETDAFKFRGVCHSVALLTPAELANGVVTHASGNHGIALSYHAQQKEIPRHIVLVGTSCSQMVNFSLP